MTKGYLLDVTAIGRGNTPQEAWEDAAEGFVSEPGPAPGDYEIEIDDVDEYKKLPQED